MQVDNNLKIQQISPRVSLAYPTEKQDDSTIVSIVILPYTEKWRMWGLLLWIVAWTICGLLVLSSYKLAKQQEQKLFIIIFFFFWIYYEWKIINVYLWKKWGKERLWVKDNKLFVEESGWKYRKVNSFKIQDINGIDIEELNEKVFSDFMSNNFWSKGKPRLKINVLGKNYYCCYQLTDKEVRSIALSLMKVMERNRG
jgi:hypothetical protein